ncbi:regulatory protein RecX [Glaciibacter superstes]|uniref:regulatory protein RecX n=1 Tax=Glaciibacter superstes TaxID=501023 RepID=UPI0003B2FE2A|nr:regulatory protein RecX [Glaciibacter superstes]
MVQFEPSDGAKHDLAPVTYLPGASPGMKRRSPLEGRGDATQIVVAAQPTDSEATAGEPMAGADEFDSAEERERAEKLLLSRLRSRSLSEAEAFSILEATDIDPQEASDIVAHFSELKYIDDHKLADQIIHSHHQRKGLGRTGVEAEMRRRRIHQFVIIEKLEELPDDEAERAIDLAVKRVAQLSRFDDETADRRLTGFLMRKGYTSSAVRAAVKTALATRTGSSGSGVRFR